MSTFFVMVAHNITNLAVFLMMVGASTVVERMKSLKEIGESSGVPTFTLLSLYFEPASSQFLGPVKNRQFLQYIHTNQRVR